MRKFPVRILLALLAIAGIVYACAPEVNNKYEAKSISLDPETAASEAAKIRKEMNVEILDDLKLDLWAADSIVQDPIAISVAPDGRIFYTRASRQTSSEFDIRGHMDWTVASMSFETVEDRREFLRKTFEADNDQSMAHLKDLNNDGVRDWRDLTVEKENVWYVTDKTGDGVADYTQRYLEDFGEEITDVANGIEYHDGNVYVAVGPDLWKASDENNDGIADGTEALAHGFAVHIGFSGHGMSGVTVGPQGRIWWGIGDIGSNVTDKDGKNWKYPNRGVVVRCDPDGSNYEVFAHGVRNTHEFAFDQFGNLITVDNDGDHAGERERLVYLIDGSDTGWRINWQFGKYTDDKNNDYKVWMDEKMSLARNDEQAAYFLPAIQNFVNGPTGLVYNPGTALSPDYYDRFFVAEFRGSPNNSPIHSFSMKPDGAGFALADHDTIVKGLLPTGLDFGPEGSLYFGDWINGWGTKNEGRIWKLDVGADAGAETELRKEVGELLTSDFSRNDEPSLAELLGHQDQRIRFKAQFELAKRAENGFEAFREVSAGSKEQLARIHAIWGMSMMNRRGYEEGEGAFAELLLDADAEIIAQAAKMIGDLKQSGHAEALIGLLGHPSARVRFFAMEALGRTEETAAVEPIVAMLREDDGQDPWLRHGGMVALGRIGDAVAMRNLAADPSRNVRLLAVVALRRMESPEVKAFLQDEDEYVVAEAARAINDDFTIPGAMWPLASTLNARAWTSEPLIRRAINAAVNVGNDRAIDELVKYVDNTSNPAPMRAEALAALGTWADPSVFDRVDGRYRGVRKKSAVYVTEKLGSIIPELIAKGEAGVRKAAIRASSSLELKGTTDQLATMMTQDGNPDIRAESLVALDKLHAPNLEQLLRTALNDRNDQVRRRALELLPASTIEPASATKLYRDIIVEGTVGEAQSALAGLAKLPGAEGEALLGELIGQMAAGKLPAVIHLDLVEAVEAHDGNTELQKQLSAYEEELMKTDDLGLMATALAGGNKRAGYRVFYRNTTAQCTRCHAIFEYGGNVGPNLAGVGHRLSPRELLTSIIRPSEALAPGHETVLVTLNNEEMLSGIVVSRTPEYLEVKTGKTETKKIPRADIAEEETLPSSMPSVDGKISRREIRNLVAFLTSLKGEEG
ncbi:heme-binding protein [Neolewinella aurantiaca]|uniref:Heme-binding protein n=1 Tax=Neolewinella aurantiaca TaxID=2602767 RepID=A0A5C7FJS1_9BACT|nr:HEAT repeat domain-containing protein [Neolewinella aurantiaca]TXF90128.1 heme-binding protein [Neolewinella aurantiaca]